MPRFFTADELGTVKSVRYSPADTPKEWKADIAVLAEGGTEGKVSAAQKLAAAHVSSEYLLAAARADGTASVYDIDEDAGPSVLCEWKETRLKSGQRHVGLSISERQIYSCTSNGALRLTQLGEEKAVSNTQTAALPMRLCDWRLSAGGDTFAYGGDEVELSVWSSETAFSPQPEANSNSESKKRKRDQLLPGEIWRAKNVPNDGLSLRQPIHITSLTYLESSGSISYHHLLTGTQEGNVRRYDTRAARRPVADWKGVGKIGGVSIVEKGLADHEVFVADNGSNLFALDLRNGRVIYGYNGLAGAVTSIAPSPALLASVSQDRFLRLHSTFRPPAEAGHQQEQKGEVLDKVYMKAIPTVVVWDQDEDATHVTSAVDESDSDSEEGAEDDVWDAMEVVEEGDKESRRRSRKSRAAS